MTKNKDMWVVEGKIDAISSANFQANIMEAVEETEENLVLDCRRLEFVSSAGLRVFLMAQKAMGEKNLTLELKNVPSTIDKIFKMTGFDRFLKING